MFRKKKVVFFTALLFLGFFIFSNNAFSAPISLEQIDVGDETVGLPFTTVASNSGKVVLDNGDVVFKGRFTGSADTQIYYYNHTTGDTTLISVAPDGETEGDGDSSNPTVSADGNYVAFESYSTNLVASDTNGSYLDVFIRNIATGTTSIVSVSSSEIQGEGESAEASISSDGNYVVFQSGVALVAEDTNDQYDIYLRNISLGTTTRVSVDSNEVQSNNTSYNPFTSSDGNYIVFESYATNLVASDTNGVQDVFLRDITLGTTVRVSVDSNEVEGESDSLYSSISSDGNYIAFYSSSTNLVAGDTNGSADIFLRDITLGTTVRISVDSNEVEGDSGASSNFVISPDGNYVVFQSDSTNLVAGDTNGMTDIFLRDIALGTTTRVSVSSSEVESNDVSYRPSISPDGNYVAFDSNATNLVAGDVNALTDIFLRDITLGTTILVSDAEKFTTVSYSSDSTCSSLNSQKSISSDNRYIVFCSWSTNIVSGDTNAQSDIFLRDTQGDTTEIISVSSSEVIGNDASSYPSISADGNYIVFESVATNLVAGDTNGQPDIFLRDVLLGTTTRISVDSSETESDGESHSASISADGNYVVFYSFATNLVAGDTNGVPDIFLRDIALGTTTRISLSDALAEGNDNSDSPSISSDGNIVAFRSYATNMVTGDTNGASDIFIHNITIGTTTRISLNDSLVQGNSTSDSPSISADGNYVVFQSNSTNLVTGDLNGMQDIFFRDITLATTSRISIDSTEVEGDSTSYGPSISDDGSYVAFYSDATNLVTSDTNSQSDIFLRDIDLGTTTRSSTAIDSTQGNNASNNTAISPDGLFLAFVSTATNLIDGVTGPGGGNYFLARVLEEPEAESEVQVSRSSSGSSRALRTRLLNNNPVLNPNTPVPCTNGALFSSLTGKLCDTTVPPVKFQFLKNLSLGIINADVKELQKYLNSHGFPVATIGTGSLGNETEKFGALTKKALIKFQQSKNITPAVGFFGPITRGVVNGGI